MPRQLQLPINPVSTQEEINQAIDLIPGLVVGYQGMSDLIDNDYFQTKKFEYALDDITQAMFEDVVTVMTTLHPEIAAEYYTEFFDHNWGYDYDLEDAFHKLYGIGRK